MIIQFNTDSNIESNPELVQEINATIENSLEHYESRITRVEVHLRDENTEKRPGNQDIRCLLEARLSGLQPIAVSDTSTTLKQAVDGAVEKLKHSLETTIGRLENHNHLGHPLPPS